MNHTGPDILLVEDNMEEARLIAEILKQLDSPPRMKLFQDGREALTYLKEENSPEHTALPRLILLDLNMPNMDGREFLKIVKTDDLLKRIPVVILSGSESGEDISAAYRQNANGYVTKPADLEAYREAIRGIGEFWLSTVTLPPH